LSYKRQATDTSEQLKCPGTGLPLGFAGSDRFVTTSQKFQEAMFNERTFLKLFYKFFPKIPGNSLCEHNQNTPGHLLQTVYGTLFGNFRVFAKNF